MGCDCVKGAFIVLSYMSVRFLHIWEFRFLQLDILKCIHLKKKKSRLNIYKESNFISVACG